MELKEILLSLRREKGLSQAELAEELGVSRQAVSRWEAGLAVPSGENLIALSRVYGVTVEELYRNGRGEEPPKPPLDQGADLPKRKGWVVILFVTAFCGGTLLWGWLTYSIGAAKVLLELVGFLSVLGWLLYNLHIAFSYYKKRKDDM